MIPFDPPRPLPTAASLAADAPTSRDCPLVSFLILAYNQEKYIEEAVTSALAQTYEPMEIILSDDGSSDRTLEIMKEVAARYQGRKVVTVRRTAQNMGTFLHVVDAVRVSTGDLLVLAAGDDISKPTRAAEVAARWQATGAWGFFSRFDRVTDNGEVISEGEDPRTFFPGEYRLRHYLAGDPNTVQIIHGATSAYDRRLFDYLDVRQSDYVLSEDGVMSVLLNMLGKDVQMIDKSLVYYRQNAQSLTNSDKNRKLSLAVIRDDEFKIERFTRSHANRCELFLRWSETIPTTVRKLNVREIQSDLANLKVRAAWRQCAFGEKLSFVLRNFHRRELKWAVPRLLPMPLFFRVKLLLARLL